jgi:tetratricopeptide (TPR) repeat protein
MDEMQFIRSTIVDVEDDRAAQVQQDRQMLKSILRKCGSQFTVNLLTSRLRQEDGSHDYSDYYNSLEFALIRVLYEVGETGIAQQRNEQLLMRLLVRHQQMTSSESATSSLIRLIISVLLCLTNQLSRDSRYREAEAALRQVLPIASQQLGSQDLAVLRLLKDIGASCRHQGKYMEAIGMLQSIMDQINAILNNSEMEEEVRKRWQGLYVEVMVEFACYYRNVNNLVDARNMLTSALEMAHTLFLPDNPLLRQIEGLVNRMDGRTADLLAKTIATHGAESKEYWKVLYDQGQDKINSHPVLAAELLLLAYELSRQLPEHGERHLLTTSCLQHHARALLVNGQIEEGMQKLFRCYELRKEIWTEYHDKTITTLFYYAGAVQQSGNLELALEYYQRCLVLENGAVQQQLMRPTNDLICATCNRIARLFDQLGNLEEARVFAEESYLRSVEGSGEGDPSTIARRRYWESLHQSRR